MSQHLHNLENNEAILLMYLADELDAEDRAEVEQMLAADAQLRAQLNALSAAQRQVETALSQSDAHQPLFGMESERGRVVRAMRQWQLEKTVGLSRASVKPIRSIPGWVKVSAALAASFAAFMIWWGKTAPSVDSGFPSYAETLFPGFNSEWAERREVARVLVGSLENYNPLDEFEIQLETLALLRDPFEL